MSYENVRDMVSHRLHDTGQVSPSALKTVSLRLPEETVALIDLLVPYLGYASRQQVMLDLMVSAVSDAMFETLAVLRDGDQAAHDDFQRDWQKVLSYVDSEAS